MKRNSYYTVLVRDDEHSRWQIHFGDYNKTVAEQERDDISDRHYLKKNTRIITTTPGQTAIDAAVDRLNSVPFDPPYHTIAIDKPPQLNPDAPRKPGHGFCAKCGGQRSAKSWDGTFKPCTCNKTGE